MDTGIYIYVLLMESYILTAHYFLIYHATLHLFSAASDRSSIKLLREQKTSFSTYPLGDSVDLLIVLPSAHHLEIPGTKKERGWGGM